MEILYSSREVILLERGNIATPKARVWTELSEQLRNKISAKALYTIVKLNRHNVWSVLGFSNQTKDPGNSDTESSESGSLYPKRWNTRTRVPEIKKGSIQF